jgi:hypothetical protein
MRGARFGFITFLPYYTLKFFSSVESSLYSTQALQTTAQQVNKQITILTYMQKDKPCQDKPSSFFD